LTVRTLRFAIATRDIPGGELDLLDLEELADATVTATLASSAPTIPAAPDFQDLRDQLKQVQDDAWEARDEVRRMRGVEKMKREIVTHDSREAARPHKPALQDTEYTVHKDPRQIPLPVGRES